MRGFNTSVIFYFFLLGFSFAYFSRIPSKLREKWQSNRILIFFKRRPHIFLIIEFLMVQKPLYLSVVCAEDIGSRYVLQAFIIGALLSALVSLGKDMKADVENIWEGFIKWFAGFVVTRVVYKVLLGADFVTIGFGVLTIDIVILFVFFICISLLHQK